MAQMVVRARNNTVGALKRKCARFCVRSSGASRKKPSLSASACAPYLAISGSKKTFSYGLVNRLSRQHFNDAR
jgi:hypothetical protein